MRTWIMSVVIVYLCSGAATTVYAQDVAKYLSASTEFEHLASQATRESGMPRIKNKKTAKLISTISDSHRFLDSATYRLDDLGSVMDMCGKMNAAVMSYVLFDLKSHIDPKSDPQTITATTIQLMEKNIISYQDELEQLQPFLVRCMAKAIPLLSEFVLSLKPEEFTEVRRAGLQQARHGMLSIYFGFLQAANNPAYKESYRSRIIQAMGETAPQYSSILQIADRRRVLELATDVQANSPVAIHGYLGKIADAMSETSCNGLCQF